LATRRNATAPRYPGGKIRQEKQHSPTEVKRLRDAAMRGMRDEEWGTEFARMYLTGTFSSIQYSAGRRFRVDLAEYRRAIDASSVRGVSYERGIQSHPPDPDSYEGQKQAELDGAATSAFLEAHRKLVKHAGVGAEMAVRRLVEHNQALEGYYDLKRAIHGLDVLAEHYRLTRVRK
jgi:hypothetical protein